MRYSLCPERYSRRPTTTSPGFRCIAGFSAARFFFRNFDSPLLLVVASSGSDTSSSLFATAVSVFSVPSVLKAFSAVAPYALSGTATGPVVELSSAPPFRTNSAASTTSGSTSVSVTSDSPMGGRFWVPLKMQSDMRSARSDLWLCSPRTQEIASTMLDLPQPLGPIMHVRPLPLKVICVFSQKDLKPTNSTLRSLSKISPLCPPPSCAGSYKNADVSAETGSDSWEG